MFDFPAYGFGPIEAKWSSLLLARIHSTSAWLKEYAAVKSEYLQYDNIGLNIWALHFM